MTSVLVYTRLRRGSQTDFSTMAGRTGDQRRSPGDAYLLTYDSRNGPEPIRCRLTTTCASAERPSPTGPTFSAVLNFTAMRSNSRPRVSAQPLADGFAVVFQLGTFEDD